MPDSYEQEKVNNNARMNMLFQSMFPNVELNYQYVYELLQFLNTTQVNAAVLPKVIRGVNNILLGTGKGQVIVHVIKDSMNVSVRENDDPIETKT